VLFSTSRNHSDDDTCAMEHIIYRPASENMPPRTLLHCYKNFAFSCFVSCDRRGFLAESQSQTIHKEVSLAFSDHMKTPTTIIHLDELFMH
jgi:hypothetical protein